MKIIFLGAPGAGKGTQAENVSKKLNIPAVSTGAMIRESIKNKTVAGLAAKAYADAGKLVPDESVIKILRERLAQKDCVNGFILDGFPRNIAQAEALERMGIDIDFAIYIYVSDEKIIERMSGRRACGECGASYHIVYKPSSKGEYCERCGQRLTFRSDDAPEVVRQRLEVYHEQTEPLLKYYADRGRLYTVLGQEKVEDTTKLTFAALNKASEDAKQANKS